MRPKLQRRLLTVAVVAVIVGTQGGAASWGQALPRPPFDFSGRLAIPKIADDAPNILFISIDSLRADHLGCYGYERPTSPHIDALAKEGVVFESSISSTSWTLPSHVAMFTSLPDTAHGVRRPMDTLAIDHPLLAEVLQEAGYQTAGFFGGPLLHPSFGFGNGFDEYVDCTAKELQEGKDITNPGIFREVSSWLEKPPTRPFFLFIHYWDVHSDYIPPAPYDTMFDPHYRGKTDFTKVMENRALGRNMDPADFQHLIALYDGEIRWTDEWLGKLFELLRRKQLWEDTLVVLTADHGEEFFDHGMKGHRKSLYDEVLRVPLIVRYPGGVSLGVRRTEQVRSIDIYPTILDLVGIGGVPGLLGRSLVPLLGEDPGKWTPVAALGELHFQLMPLQSLRREEWKIIRDVKKDTAMFFDLSVDPRERVAVVPSSDSPKAEAALEELRFRFDALDTVRQTMSRISDETIQLDPELLERLRSLGYVD